MKITKIKFAHYLAIVTDGVYKSLLPLIAILVLILLFLTLRIGKTNQEKLEQIPTPSYPLEFTAPQNILREPPVFHLDEPISVEAKFVNKSDMPVKVTAVVHWVLIEPIVDGNYIDVAQFGLFLDFKPGCTQQTFINKPEPQVDLITRQLFAKGHQKVTWQLSGANLIVLPENSGSQQFSVDSFSYIPDDTPLPVSRNIPDDRARC